MKKKIWITSLETSEPEVQKIIASLKKYGLDVDGHFWEDDLRKMAWCGPRKDLLGSSINMWIIHGTAETFARPSIIYGLSLLTLSIQARRGINFPIVILQEGAASIDSGSLPVFFADCKIHPVASAIYGAKIVADLHKTYELVFPPYRLDAYGIPQVGQWFEIGPREGEWEGAIFGIVGETILLHAVGPAGQLPEKSVLNYAQKGLEIKFGDKEFSGWAVQNKIDEKTSYYVKVDGHPETIMFCPYSQDDDTEAYVIDLK